MFLWRIGRLFPLYTDARTRETVKSALIAVTTREGWLLSDIEILSVSSDRISVLHRDHLRRRLPTKECTIDLKNSTLSCAD